MSLKGSKAHRLLCVVSLSLIMCMEPFWCVSEFASGHMDGSRVSRHLVAP